MAVKEMGLVWIVVKDFKKAVKYYTEVVGLKVLNKSDEYHWAELGGTEEGARFGIAEHNSKNPVQPGSNAVPTFTVANLEQAKKRMIAKGAECVGGVEEVPGHVKMQLVRDADQNLFQIVEMLGSFKQ